MRSSVPADLLERLVDAMASNDIEAVAALYTDDCLIADPVMVIRGKDGLREALRAFFGAFHLTAVRVEHVISEADELAVRWSWSVIHQGEYLGVPATGKPFHTWNVMLLKVRDGRFCSDTSVWDAGELRRLEALAGESRAIDAQPAGT
jgi:steroid delta-isomerase-like uncharacterized protein